MNQASVYLWMMAFTRAGGLVTLMPVFSGKSVPMQLRVAIAAFLGFAGAAMVKVPVAVPTELIGLILSTIHEMLIGLLMGLAVRMIFFAVEMAGQMLSTEIGLSVSSQIDPISQNNSTVVGSALFMFASLLFLISGSHHECILAFVRSFELVPPGAGAFHRGAGELFVQTTGSIFLQALQMTAPLMAMNFVVTLSFAVLSKAAPGVNAFAESFAVRITAGLTLLALSLGLTAQLVLSQLRQSPELMLRMIP